MQYTLTAAQVAELKSIIDAELEARCFRVETTLSITEKRGETRFELNSSRFQTVPVIHRDLHIVNFSGGVWQSEEDADIVEIGIHVHVAYSGNSVGLFQIHARANKKNPERIFLQSVNTIHA